LLYLLVFFDNAKLRTIFGLSNPKNEFLTAKNEYMKQRIGQHLLDIREQRNMTQAEMAHLLDVPLATYSRYERNESSVEYSKMVSFADKLKVPIQELLPDTVTINNSNSGQGGSIVFGNQIVYVGDSVVNQSLAQENKSLKDELALLKQQMQNVLATLGAKNV
jgi:transcriptional regulator with XRE-family HTH domain